MRLLPLVMAATLAAPLAAQWDGPAIATLLRQHADQITGIAAGWIAFEFLIFIVRARRAAAPAA